MSDEFKNLCVVLDGVLMCSRKVVLEYFPVSRESFRKLERAGKAPQVKKIFRGANYYRADEVVKFLSYPPNFTTDIQQPPLSKPSKELKCVFCGKLYKRMRRKGSSRLNEFCSRECWYNFQAEKETW